MPKGFFLLRWTEDGYKIVGKYWQEGDASAVESLLMRISISIEAGKKFSKIPTNQGTIIYSHLAEFKDENRKMQKIIAGAELDKDEEPENFKQMLMDLAKSIQEHINAEPSEFEQIFSASCISSLGGVAGDKAGELRTKLVTKAKELISKQEIDKANKLLELTKTAPDQLQNLIDKGNSFLNQGKVDEAEKYYKDAISLAEKMKEKELAAELRSTFKRISQRPKVIQKIKNLEQKAKKAMKDENFKKAAELFKNASKEAANLNDVDLMNEFAEKSQLLMRFDAIDNSKNRTYQ
ncbi:MAG: hypothetical protein ACFFCS_11895 [Candidatus Hodarchaeota archaeon]